MTNKNEMDEMDESVDLSANSVLIALTLGRPGNRRKVASSQVSVDADPDAIKVSKELLDSAELKAIETLDGDIRRYVYRRSVPTFGLKSGVYRLASTLVEEVDEELTEMQTGRGVLVEMFLSTYASRVERAQARLRGLFDSTDYPPVESVRGSFTCYWRYLRLETPTDALAEISPEIVKAEIEKARESARREVEAIRDALRTQLTEFLEHSTERLSVRDGKKMVFRDSLVENLDEFLEYFDKRNIIGDERLSELASKARDVLRGKKRAKSAPSAIASTLRENDGVREGVRAAFARIKKEVDEEGNVVRARTRRIELE